VEVLSFEQKTKEYVEAKVQVTAPDLYGVIKKLDEEEFSSEAEIDEALTEGIKSAERITKDLNVNFYYKDEWTPSLTEEFMDACYGGIITLRREYYEDMKGVS
jgi:hypothetical protein